jgi:glycosyltransferase involved in cell wall biosynthesis
MTASTAIFRAQVEADRGPQRGPLHVCIVSGESRRGSGGLSAYSRMIIRQLLSEGVGITTVARFDRPEAGVLDYAAPSIGDGSPIDGIPTILVEPSRGWRPFLRQLCHVNDRPLLRGLAPKIFARAFKRSLARAIPHNCDVVHFIGAGRELLGFAALAIARSRGAAFTILPAVHTGSWGDSPLDIDLYKRCDAVFCQSRHEMDHLESLGVSRSRLMNVPLAPVAPAEGDGRAFRNAHGLQERPLVLFIGRRTRGKGFHALCEAMPKILQKVPDVCLVAIGPATEPPFPDVPPHAYLDLGKTSESEKADALTACTLFCMPSTTEAFGLVYTEAWSYAKPVIGGLSPAVRELITDDRDGYCVEQNPHAIASAVCKLLQDDELRERLGSAGRRLQSSRYIWPAVTQNHLDIFGRVSGYRTMPVSPSWAH